jgi:glycosyltransferase involved in cell wall biosynthesis
VIHNGRSPALFNPHSDKQDIVLSVGRVWDAGKQVNLLTESELQVPVCIVGEQRHTDESLRRQSVAQPGSQGVKFRGPQSESQLRSWYGRAAIYAATSRYEPFGLAPLEAAFSRCAVVANDIPTFRELWGQTACYFRRNDASSLAETIARLRADRELRLTYANLVYNRARRRFTAARMVDEYLSLYRSMITAGAAAA